MGIEKKYVTLISGESKGILPRMARSALYQLSRLYQQGVKARNDKFDRGVRQSMNVEVPVISVGNITAGGTGKTPMVRYICEYLEAMNLFPVILSRGYKARDNSVPLIISDGKTLFANEIEAGDEAYLLATMVPRAGVVIGRRKTDTAKVGIEKLQADILVVDDGFQHRQLARDVDLLLVDATNPFGYGYVLPRGLLREPRENCRRADHIVLTKANQVGADSIKELKSILQTIAPGCPISVCRHKPMWIQRLADWRYNQGKKEEVPLEKAVVAMSAIGNPKSFVKTLEEAGMNVLAEQVYGDHYSFIKSDIFQCLKVAKEVKAEAIVVTEKDAVKLSAFIEDGDVISYNLPIYVLGIEIEFLEGEEAFCQSLLSWRGDKAS